MHHGELPHRNAPEPKPLTERQARELRDHRAQLEEEARRKKTEEETAWMRRARIDIETGEKRSAARSTGSSSSDSPIRRVETPPELPAHWTAEERANHERLIKEGLKVAVFEPHRLDKDKIVRHDDYVTVHWDEYMNIDIPWHRFRLKPGSVRA
jgi:eukaryotic translation initiation factor 2C